MEHEEEFEEIRSTLDESIINARMMLNWSQFHYGKILDWLTENKNLIESLGSRNDLSGTANAIEPLLLLIILISSVIFL